MIVAVDPGTDRSAIVRFNGQRVVDHYIAGNDEILATLRATCEDQRNGDILVIEQIESFGMPVGREVFETVFFTGRIAELWHPGRVERVPRRVVKQHLCFSVRATDANIWQALVDRFGPTKERAVGTKKAPGPLFGIKSHERAALAVAITFHDQSNA